MRLSFALLALAGFSQARRARQETPLQICEDELCANLSDQGNIKACEGFCNTAIQLDDGYDKVSASPVMNIVAANDVDANDHSGQRRRSHQTSRSGIENICEHSTGKRQ